jgi:tRNA(Ile)-lysidine synthase
MNAAAGVGAFETTIASLRAFFADTAPVAAGDRLLVAFSGGSDSTALLLALGSVAAQMGLHLEAAHLDHGADPDSARRARRAGDLAAELGVPFRSERAELPALRARGESREEAARRVRYAFLERRRLEIGACWTVTAHHRDDQAETLLLRLLQGSGWRGLAGIAPVHGRVVRPLLALTRASLRDLLRARGLEPVLDPTNRDPALARNAVRHELLPGLLTVHPDLQARLARLAAAARGARDMIDRRLAEHLDLRGEAGGAATMALDAFDRLPAALRSTSLALLHRQAGAAYPPSTAAACGLERAIARRGRVACDAGGGWRWLARDGRLRVERPGNNVPPFAYTLRVPGDVQIPELGAVLSLRRGEPNDAASTVVFQRERLSLPAEPGAVLVRNRRPGDRIRPAGRRNRKRLKEVLIDHRIPRQQRDALPLLVLGGEVAWVPGVTVADGFQVAAGDFAWTAELSSIDAGEVDPS